MKAQLLAVLSLGALLVLAGRAAADDEIEAKIARLFEKYDADGDGRITPAELTDEGVFKSLDRDGDGAITRSDLSAPASSEKPALPSGEESPAGGSATPDKDEPGAGGTAPEPRKEEPGSGSGGEFDRGFAELDTDGDGRISQDEYVEFQKRLFSRMDADGDGSLDHDEARKLAERLASVGGKGGGEGAERREKMKERFLRMDKDGDGAVSREEWEGPSEIFDRLDGDADGKLTTEELAGAMRGGLRGRDMKRDRPGADSPDGGEPAPGEGEGK
ncbi:MAG: EF-hand domain-containing protein [Planctomycetes bacterium]|nr:EF-hand domain-containing protein [Planctomycetota bacterium]